MQILEFDVSIQSRESWAAIHQGVVPHVYEDANFQDWQRWHRALDKMELRRRRKRTIDFIEESEHLASLYLDEMLAQRAIQIHVRLSALAVLNLLAHSCYLPGGSAHRRRALRCGSLG